MIIELRFCLDYANYSLSVPAPKVSCALEGYDLVIMLSRTGVTRAVTTAHFLKNVHQVVEFGMDILEITLHMKRPEGGPPILSALDPGSVDA